MRALTIVALLLCLVLTSVAQASDLGKILLGAVIGGLIGSALDGGHRGYQGHDCYRPQSYGYRPGGSYHQQRVYGYGYQMDGYQVAAPYYQAPIYTACGYGAVVTSVNAGGYTINAEYPVGTRLDALSCQGAGVACVLEVTGIGSGWSQCREVQGGGANVGAPVVLHRGP